MTSEHFDSRKILALAFAVLLAFSLSSQAIADSVCGRGRRLVDGQFGCAPDGSGGGNSPSYSGGGNNYGAAISAGLGLAGALLGAVGSMSGGSSRSREPDEPPPPSNQWACEVGDLNRKTATGYWSDRMFEDAANSFDEAAGYYDRCNRSDVGDVARSNAATARRLQAEKEQRERDEEQREREEEAARQRQERDRQAAQQRAEQRKRECQSAFDQGRASQDRGFAAWKAGDFASARAAFLSAQDSLQLCGANETSRQNGAIPVKVAQNEAEVRQAEERKKAEEARQAECRLARHGFVTGENALRALNPKLALRSFEVSAEAFAKCGEQPNVASARHNAGLARKMDAILTEEAGRLAAAEAKYGGATPYKQGGNPFAMNAADIVPETERATVRLDLGNLYGEAGKLCKGQAEQGSPGWKSCMRQATAAVIRKYEPEVAGYCSATGDAETRIDCVNNRYLNTVQGKVRVLKASVSEDTSYNDLGRAPRGPRAHSLRETLRKRLNESLAREDGNSVAPPPTAQPNIPKKANGGSAVSPGVVALKPAPARKSSQDEILDGLPQYTAAGALGSNSGITQ